MTFDLEQRWPELFDQLDPQQRQDLLATLHNQYLEGAQFDRQSVADLADFTRGAITGEDHTQRVLARLTARQRLPGPPST